jgi:hypothetical protein
MLFRAETLERIKSSVVKCTAEIYTYFVDDLWLLCVLQWPWRLFAALKPVALRTLRLPGKAKLLRQFQRHQYNIKYGLRLPSRHNDEQWARWPRFDSRHGTFLHSTAYRPPLIQRLAQVQRMTS